jgi:hypothetical protein
LCLEYPQFSAIARHDLPDDYWQSGIYNFCPG